MPLAPKKIKALKKKRGGIDVLDYNEARQHAILWINDIKARKPISMSEFLEFKGQIDWIKDWFEIREDEL